MSKGRQPVNFVNRDTRRCGQAQQSGIPPTKLVDCSYPTYIGNPQRRFPGIPPTKLVDRSYSAHTGRTRSASGNPTNEVGGSFIPGLHGNPQRALSGNPTNEVGGSFIPDLHGNPQRRFPGIPP